MSENAKNPVKIPSKMPVYEGFAAVTDKLTVILDIGAAYTKLGFSGEFAPRNIIRSEIRCQSTNEMCNIFDYKDSQDLYDLLVEFVHALYFKYILLSPKDRPVVIIESLLCPTLFRETLAKVLFVHYEVSMVLVVPSHLVCLSTLAIDTGLILDVGYQEAVVIPVCHGLPVVHAWQALPLASQAVHGHLKNLLSLENGNLQEVPERVFEDIKVRCCFVTRRNRAKQFTQAKSELTPCPDVQYPLWGSRMINISGKIRETAFEPFFEEDNDHLCLSTMILDSILKVNVDLRIILAENLVLIGGTCMTPGFKARLRDELLEQLKSTRYEKLKIKTFKFHSPPSKENYTAWLGGAIYGSTELLSMKAVTKEMYFKENRLPDWVDMRDNVRLI